MKLQVSAKPGTEVCDFCASKDTSWEVTTKEFTIPELGLAFSGDWVACKGCADLIQSNKWKELSEKAVDSFGPQKAKRSNVLAYMTQLHNKVREGLIEVFPVASRMN